ncbi:MULTISPECIES: sarcosine oxidase subunit gamma [unclassified Mesorhizobium]|uniref:sarcosine oxidase subunit gamma n=1 Tax=unclassified Mesorhizobium TaxID=325217 RepID=UPI00112B733B|nr:MULTISPECIES: sarcosine oxidase subunit gamma [unclassified Mesorhizobium]TPI54669.1 sarcosine oxidase subunit gamma family protein [Mesorhizobium sp. B3-1-1]TPJ69793.1 sarcosine oxidase subunit gamma family protein [Mesorhizobium sp. B2-6-7]TPJ82180.1 sarcosine oxidase subunit gamma family protein [Mesorhizobium sp. B2-6-3]TPJ98309.1 sarcosine oxidase subunit gamma family protein [Mesorhizobium sp. B2-5-10]TPK08405.1 sarcosine oxidase subunit gamma family protein [Mesorhizobium sp. B2-5-11
MAKTAAKKAAPAASPAAERRPALAGRTISAAGAKVELLAPAERISLRAPEASLAALSKALGVTMPKKPKTSVSKGGRTALWLGPDEWMIIDEAGKDPLADCAKISALHSAVGISHRNVAISVAGPAAAAAINSGCPQDLSLQAFPVGAASRTILGKAEIVLLRTAQDAFRVECWRSFSDYVFTFLSEGARDAAA